MTARRGALLYALLVLVALFISFKSAIGLFWIDNDTAVPALLWDGARHHGLSWIRQWQFTPDNWLFSGTAIDFAAFALLGLKPSLVAINGWLFLVASAAISGLVARRLGAARAALAVPVLLLLPGFYAYRFGFVAYALSHNVSNLFGLAALLLILFWLERRRDWLLLPALLLLAAGTVSDPWMLVAYCAPLAVVCMFGWWPGSRLLYAAQAAKLLPVPAIPILLSVTQVFGLLAFIPAQPFRFGDWALMNQNAALFIQDLGGLLATVPFQQRNDLITSLFSGLFALGGLGLAFAAARRTALPGPTRFFFGFAAVSVAGITAGFVLSSNVANAFAGRYLLNAMYLMILAGAVAADLGWAALSGLGRRWLAALGLLFASAGLTSTAPLWLAPLAPAQTDAAAWIGFLEAHRLNYGYGPYWGPQANAVSVISRGRVLLRPITFNPVTGEMVAGVRGETSALWYRAADAPAGQTTFFVIVMSDFEQQVDPALCVRGLTRQFGRPARVLPANGVLVLVWTHPLLRG